MPADRIDAGDIDAALPEIAGELAPVSAREINGTLATRFIPIADQIRAMAARVAGLMPYRVFLVHIQWTGGAIGEGEPREISRREITPSPKVADMNATSHNVRETGMAEEGALRVSLISARFTEDDLVGKTPDLLNAIQPQTSAPGVQFFWEVAETRPSSPRPQPRYYKPNAVPMLSPGKVQWVVTLSKADYNPNRYAAGGGR